MSLIDFNLICIFVIFYEVGSVIFVVECLFVIQLLVSYVLVCLCELFDDVLFICICDGIQLIFVVEQFYGIFCELLMCIEGVVQSVCYFDLVIIE